MHIETRKVFVSEDGKSFDLEKDCVAHEQCLEIQKRRLDKIKFYSISHTPDLTEGRGYYGLTYLAVEDDYYHSEWALDFCFKNFGSALEFVMGVSPIPNWVLRETTKEKFLDYRNVSVGPGISKSGTAASIFLSNKGAYPNFPEPKQLSATGVKL